ncbi:uncharacterized protein LOC115632543 [Scaptodrosophila lebanonensis]|uniref:Uncharacterized protein LOC115632543 n=1 Tax=Drosophila lebanonensis TaxID=7225 RepID=A0A6J2UDW8_DROLE|nr:uncharacterized protein LOC115632543 [Scaptodrosophila lebanonensis]
MNRLDVMHAANKKKSRVRNRPRNKCNRVDETKDNGDSPNQSDAAISSSSNVEKEPSAPTGKTNDAIRLIQQLLRNKLLAKSKEAGKNSRRSPSVPVEVPPPAMPVKKTDEMSELLKCIGGKLQKGAVDTSTATATLFSNLGRLFNQEPVSDIESSDDEAEYVEYIYRPRSYFMVSLCNLCKADLRGLQPLPCTRCGLSYYCSAAHMQNDQSHRQLCYGLRQLVEHNGHDIFYKCGDFNNEQFRSYRIVCIRQLEKNMNRPLTATEQEVLLFPRICNDIKCREHRFKRLDVCRNCGEVSFCKDKPNHLSSNHALWCAAYQLFKAFVVFQDKFGRLEPSLPNRVLKDLPMACCNTRQMMKKLNFNVTDQCEYAALTQVSTGPLTAWYALKLCERLRNYEQLTVHLIGAEIEFEVDVLQKWELFLLHLTPAVKTLNVVFVGPELNPRNISFEQLKKMKCCRLCRKAQRTVQYHFENHLFHDYCAQPDFLKPDIVCFFNSGLHRATGYALEDTWPDTIRAALDLKCPIVVTSYTNYEAPLDMSRFVNESNRHFNIVLPPTTNPFASEKPERNFISDEDTPFMFKNFNCFVVE